MQIREIYKRQNQQRGSNLILLQLIVQLVCYKKGIVHIFQIRMIPVRGDHKQ